MIQFTLQSTGDVVGDQSVLLTQLVVTGAQFGLALVVGRLVLAALLVGLARACGAIGRPRVGARIGALGVRVCPALVRGAVATLLGVTVVAGVTVVPASATSSGPRVPLLDRVVTEVAAPGPPAWHSAPSTSTMPRARLHVYVVRGGDSLWSIAAAHLGPDDRPAAIARAWPRWFAANRGVVGADPDRLRPGEHLRTPRPRRRPPPERRVLPTAPLPPTPPSLAEPREESP